MTRRTFPFERKGNLRFIQRRGPYVSIHNSVACATLNAARTETVGLSASGLRPIQKSRRSHCTWPRPQRSRIEPTVMQESKVTGYASANAHAAHPPHRCGYGARRQDDREPSDPRDSQTLQKDPDRMEKVTEIAEFGCTVIAQYAVLGQCDFVTVVEASDNATVTHPSVDLRSRGMVNSMPCRRFRSPICAPR
jgi:uncharacterized protein with GYD domain